MNHGLNEKTVNKILSVFERFPTIEKAVLYGSRAKGNFKKGSDIDLTLYGDELTFSLLANIVGELDDLLLPYTIDLSIFDDLNHAKLREHIERVGVVFYEKKNQNMKAGWEIKTLGEVCDFLNRGISPKYVEQGGVYVLNQKCVRNHRISYEQARRHDTSIKSVSAERFIQLGDVLVNSTGTGTLGRVAQIRDEPTTVDSHVTIVRPKKNQFFPDFFGYMLILIEEAIKDAGEGCGGQTELARAVLAEKFSVSYPISVTEQKRLVTLLDEAFESIATAKANAQQNLKNARALFESHLNEVFTKRGEGWESISLETAAVITNGFAFKSDDFSSVEGAKCIKIANVGVKEFVSESTEFLPADFTTKYDFASIKKGSIVIALTRTIIKDGLKVAVVADEYDGALLNQRVAAILPKSEKVLSPFLFAYLSTQEVVSYVKARVNTLMQPNLSITDLRLMPIPLPTIQEQKIISEKFDALREETQRLEALYSRKIAALDELKKALLHRAFSGEL